MKLLDWIRRNDKKGFRVSRQLPQNSVMVVCIGATIGKVGITSKPSATKRTPRSKKIFVENSSGSLTIQRKISEK